MFFKTIIESNQNMLYFEGVWQYFEASRFIFDGLDGAANELKIILYAESFRIYDPLSFHSNRCMRGGIP